MEKANQYNGNLGRTQEDIVNPEEKKIEILYDNIAQRINGLYEEVSSEIEVALAAGVSKDTLVENLVKRDFFEQAKDSIKLFTNNQQWSEEAEKKVSLSVEQFEERVQKEKVKLLELLKDNEEEVV